MPSKGLKQYPAGVNKSKPVKNIGTRTMRSRNRMIESALKIDDVPYVGNAVLNANNQRI